MSEIIFQHTPVLLFECIEGLAIRDGYTYVDCTTGGGGHSYEIAKRLGAGSRLICLDRDKTAIEAARERLREFGNKITFVNENYSELGSILRDLGVDNLGGVLADLGCSSYQFDTPERGFSYMHDARLDMRMSTDDELDAYYVVNNYSEDELRRIIFEYGEEKFGSRIASAICSHRAEKPIETTLELSEIIKNAIPTAARTGGPHPAKRTFQAIRIEVNGELAGISPMIRSAVNALTPGGRIAIISFHSLEDRAVKTTFRDLMKGCTCPKDFPVCVCHNTPKIKEIYKKPILPSEEELTNNPRSRSAKLRVAEKL